MKKITLLETYLHEKDSSDPDFRGKVNKELGGFKSLLHGDDKKEKHDDPDFRGKVNKELGKAKFGMHHEDLDLNESGEPYEIYEKGSLIGSEHTLRAAMEKATGKHGIEVQHGGHLVGHTNAKGDFVHGLPDDENFDSDDFSDFSGEQDDYLDAHSKDMLGEKHALFGQDNKKGFGMEPEDPFAAAIDKHNDHRAEMKFNTPAEDAFSDAFHKHVNEVTIEAPEEQEPLDSMEHVQLIIHPEGEHGMDPLMTPMGGCDSEDASVSTFSAPGGPDFGHNKGGADGQVVLVDNDSEIHNEAPELVVKGDKNSPHYDEGDEEWLQYLMEPEEEKHNTHSNDMKPKVTKKENCSPDMKMENAKKQTKPKNKVNENVKALKAKLFPEIKK